jgi:hypothetical protein
LENRNLASECVRNEIGLSPTNWIKKTHENRKTDDDGL